MKWHPEATRVNIPSAWSRERSAQPKRIVLAMTEFPDRFYLRGYEKNRTAPHMTINVSNGEIIQHLPFTVDSKGTATPAPTSLIDGQTIVVAMIGRSSDTANWSSEWIRFVGSVLTPVMEAFDIPSNHPRFFGTTASDVMSITGRQRFSPAEWAEFSGICGMQHVPNTTRWDPGNLNIDGAFEVVKPNIGPLPAFTRLMKKNSKSKAVEVWQRALGLAVTGRFDPETEAATVELQKALGLEPDGVVGEVTWNAAMDCGRPDDLLGEYPGTPLSHGLVGGVVSRWQEYIGIETTGIFDAATKEATKEQQRSLGLFPTGAVDEETWNVARFKATQW